MGSVEVEREICHAVSANIADRFVTVGAARSADDVRIDVDHIDYTLLSGGRSVRGLRAWAQHTARSLMIEVPSLRFRRMYLCLLAGGRGLTLESTQMHGVRIKHSSAASEVAASATIDKSHARDRASMSSFPALP